MTTADLAPGEELTFYSREGGSQCFAGVNAVEYLTFENCLIANSFKLFRSNDRVLDKLDRGVV